jgi:hypothetical protein
MHNRRVLILTNCTNRKRGSIPVPLSAHSLPKATYKAVSDEWAKRLTEAREHYVAEKLYCGRAVTETLRAADALSAEVVFLSAGLGVVPQKEPVPAYNLTSSPGLRDSIGKRINEPYSSARWWRELNNARGKGDALARLIRQREPDLILAALPASYLAMVGEEFATLPDGLRKSLRIIGPRRAEEVPDHMRSYWLPYDWRLDNKKTGYNGTTADFPHRALRHFVTELSDKALGLTVERQQALVQDALSGFKPYVRKQGISVSDEEVLALIEDLWKKHNGNRAHMLSHLRHQTPFACEQSRFRRLANRYEEQL